MSLRERVFVFVAVLVVALALVQTLLLDPAQRRQQAAQARVTAAQTALGALEKQRALLAGPIGDPDKATRTALAAVEARLAELDAQIEARGRSLVAPERMPAVLKDVVAGKGVAVRIVGFKTLAPQPVALPGAADGAPAAFYRHGFEVTVSGSYADLVAYLERLEALPWNLSWIEATLDATARPDLRLTLTVHTLSLEEAWLRV
jgi:MSHA biogenesis protein MshJ